MVRHRIFVLIIVSIVVDKDQVPWGAHNGPTMDEHSVLVRPWSSRYAVGMTMNGRAIVQGLVVAGLVALVGACDSEESAAVSEDSEPGDEEIIGSGIATADYIELARISYVSRFRSGIGHDYSDVDETCRSMKHYFTPSSYPVRIFSPVYGIVEYLREGWAGTQVGIRSGGRVFVLFHVDIEAWLAEGVALSAGQQIGVHIGTQTWSDIAVREDEQYLSYFDVMDDTVFAAYQARGVTSREQMIISKEERDADPLSCSGETFASEGNIPNWVSL